MSQQSAVKCLSEMNVSYTAIINDRFEALKGWICKRQDVGIDAR